MKLEINPELIINVVEIADGFNCVFIDQFLLNPQDLVDYASTHADEFIAPERAYPGVVLPVDNEWAATLNRFIRLEMSRLFSFCRGGIEFHSQFSLTTLKPEQLTWEQRLCKNDPSPESGRKIYAALLYLFDKPELGGTGFYRWKDQPFWEKFTSVQRDDPDTGLDILRERFQMFRDLPCYMTESNEAAVLLDKAPAKFNRLVFYSGDLPHSAYISRPELLSPDPSTGRLTLNNFASVWPKK